ncbi:hypothetical protein [Nocardia farcinica]|uniref:Uncharacterized protein n=1 Tax=Nocardia farcinica (strain IFM 10152) TaxID=247156 RepID=Q5YSI2_NOCFA|nr:hypothetical protein [Nocardia farcinica]BAD58859.1 hypothetical protein NFA_40110 [Nocardia farcinica IFM 10152]
MSEQQTPGEGEGGQVIDAARRFGQQERRRPTLSAAEIEAYRSAGLSDEDIAEMFSTD